MALRNRSGEAGGEAGTEALAREVARRSVGQLETGLARIASESGASLRWLMAALLALSGLGLLLCVLLRGAVPVDPLALGASFFAASGAMAFLAVLAAAIAALPVARVMREALAQWTEVAATGTLSEAALAAAKEVRRRTLLAYLPGLVLGTIALLLLIGGAVTLAASLSGPPVATTEPKAVPAAKPPRPAAAPAKPAKEPPAASNAVVAPVVVAPVATPASRATPPVTRPRVVPRRSPRPASAAPASQTAPASTPPLPAATPAPLPASAPPPVDGNARP